VLTYLMYPDDHPQLSNQAELMTMLHEVARSVGWQVRPACCAVPSTASYALMGNVTPSKAARGARLLAVGSGAVT
jgi:hypothetical protein